MSTKLMMFVGFLFIMGTLLSLVMEGNYIGSTEVGIINQLTGYTNVELSGPGILTIFKAGAGFLIHGVPKLITWDYAFLQNEWALLKWIILYPISIGVIWGLLLVFLTAVRGVFGRFF